MLNWPVLLASFQLCCEESCPASAGESRSFATLRMTVLKVVGWELAGEWGRAGAERWLGAGGWELAAKWQVQMPRAAALPRLTAHRKLLLWRLEHSSRTLPRYIQSLCVPCVDIYVL